MVEIIKQPIFHILKVFTVVIITLKELNHGPFTKDELFLGHYILLFFLKHLYFTLDVQYIVLTRFFYNCFHGETELQNANVLSERFFMISY